MTTIGIIGKQHFLDMAPAPLLRPDGLPTPIDRYYATDDLRVLGVVLVDHIGHDCGYAIWTRDANDRFVRIELQDPVEETVNAEAELHAHMLAAHPSRR